MNTYPVEVYIYELTPESQCWCRDQFMQIVAEDEEILHTSIVVHGVEYSYGECGIEEEEPKLRPQYVTDFFEEAASRTTTIGRTTLTKEQVEDQIAKLRKTDIWFSYKYNPVEHNCHHFSDMFLKLLCGNEAVLPVEVYEFNKRLLSYRESWIDEFYEDGNSDHSG
ncbi:hypothetical protein MTP99_005993 [Tenebrio molitor]|jgi:hypothetical protein|nr:hypothetical protein MTP99_005993 [Tenebrio molitor]CAH1383493.1 unnamed protein product [Tenebrio molitor]